jgi:predicted amidophosphoribosyltransferase
MPTPAGVDRCVALLSYEGAARELVARLKYRNARSSVAWLASAMAALVAGHAFDAVTFVPTTPARRRERGFDQAELLAAAVARELGMRVTRLLRRGRAVAHTGASAAVRLASDTHIAPRGSAAGSVLLVDDVVTTGATLSGAAGALRAAGASHLVALVAARTPPPGDLH